MSAPPLPPSPIPAPSLPEGGQSLVACSLGYPINGQSGLGYPYGYGSDVCVPVDPCLVDGMLHLEYDFGFRGDYDGTTLYTIMACNIPGEAVAVEDTVASVAVAEAPAAGTEAPQALPETGAGLTMAVIAAVLVVAGGFTMFGARRRTADITD